MRVFGRSERGLNVHKAYTWISTVYALLRKSLMYIVGLGRVELPTSRLSGPLVERGCIASHSEFAPVRASRHFRRERERGQKPPPARTHGVHAKADGYETDGHLRPLSLTNLLNRKKAAINICGGYESTAQERQAERVSRARRELRIAPGRLPHRAHVGTTQNFLYTRGS
jgi:hypothetical protein